MQQRLGRHPIPHGRVEICLNILFKVLDYTSVWSPVDSVCGLIIVIDVLSAVVGGRKTLRSTTTKRYLDLVRRL